MTNRSFPRVVGCLVAVVVLAVLLVGVSLAVDTHARPCRPSLTQRQRYGFVATSENWPQTFDADQLRAGWYVDLRLNTSPPGGMDRAMVIRTPSGQAVNPATLGPLVDSNPGALWLIGNEPDCIWQDNVLPEEYARVYHDVYAFIKTRDRTSLIAAGGIVQATPLRLQYLDRMLSAYQARYGHAMPVDVWHIHNAILNEVSCEHDPGNCWGAGIPPGINDPVGEIRAIDDNDNITLFREQIWAFRQWMAVQGYVGYPLIVTEYGILMPDDYGFGVDRVNAFMSETFDFFEHTTDPGLGDPTDEDRLVQRWAWFSLDVAPWNKLTGQGFNGNLFDPVGKEITAFGQHYASLTSSFPPLTYVDLGFAAWDMPPPPLVVSPTQAITYSLQVRVVNRGTAESGSFSVRLAYEGPVNGTLTEAITNQAPFSSQWLAFTLPNLNVGGYLLSLEIDPENQVDEAAECDNIATRVLVVPTHRLYLPLALRRSVRTAFHYGSVETQACSASSPIEPVARQEEDGFLEFQMPTEGSYPAQMALDSGRELLWVTERDSGKIACFDLQLENWCATAEYTLAPNSQPWGLDIDGDGNVWFADTGLDKIGMLDVASGTLGQPVTLTAGSQPWGVAISGVGPSTTVWFTEKGGSRIGKFVPATGAIAEITLPAPNAEPGGIDAQGAYVWFTETAANRLGRLRTAENLNLTERSIPTSNSAPRDVVIVPGGNPWLTEGQGNKIALFRADTTGWFTEIPVFTADSEPYGIAVEADLGVARAVWFTEKNGNRLARFTGEHHFPREYLLPTPNSQPTDIVVDGEGCAWYTAPGANRIGRFCPPPDTHTFLPLILRNESWIQGR